MRLDLHKYIHTAIYTHPWSSEHEQWAEEQNCSKVSNERFHHATVETDEQRRAERDAYQEL